MLFPKSTDLTYADVTPKAVVSNRRKFLRGAGIAFIGAFAGKRLFDMAASPSVGAGTKLDTIKSPFSTDEKSNSFNDVTHYNNFYEFGVGQERAGQNAKKFETSPWTVSVEARSRNRANSPSEEILKLAPLEERMYRHRCVEGWSSSFHGSASPQHSANLVEPTPKAQIRQPSKAITAERDAARPIRGIQFPYIEGLRLDEAMHPLAFSAWACMARHCPTRMARRCAWSCRGNTASRASSRS